VVHFIGPSKPWQRLHRSGTGPEDENDVYARLSTLWFDVYEQHLGHVPLAAAPHSSTLPPSDPETVFVVPHITPTWDDVSGKHIAYHPPSPDKLQNMFGTNAESLAAAYRWRLDRPEGTYTSMPLEDRHWHALFQSIRAGSPTHDDDVTRAIGTSPSTTAPPPTTRSSLPLDNKLQMEVPLNIHYTNVWDEQPTSRTGALFEPPSYAPVPEAIQQRYEDVMTAPPPPSLAPERSTPITTSNSVFPWETTLSNRPPPARVFPEDEQPLPLPPRETAGSPPSAPSSVNPYFVNAWDNIEEINRYAQDLRNAVRGVER
jgi:hypothetical protein